MSPNREQHNAKHRRELTPEERDWRAFRGESPNPWAKMNSDGVAVMEIVTQRKPSKLERRSEAETLC